MVLGKHIGIESMRDVLRTNMKSCENHTKLYVVICKFADCMCQNV